MAGLYSEYGGQGVQFFAEYSPPFRRLVCYALFLFANTPGGATGSAVMFSLIMTALENKLDPWRYLTWLIKNSDTVNDVEELLPWNTPDDCKI